MMSAPQPQPTQPTQPVTVGRSADVVSDNNMLPQQVVPVLPGVHLNVNENSNNEAHKQTGVYNANNNENSNGNNNYISHHHNHQHQHQHHLDHEGGSGQLRRNETMTRSNSGQEELEEEHQTSETGATEEIHSDCSGEDPVKLFVGQVPRTMEEADLFPIFEKYGPMEDVAIIRDKHTGQHRGCAFVTFFSKENADACEKELHNTFTFEGGKRAVQIRPAGRKDEIENKIFVGMLPRNVPEETVRELFEPYGEIKGIFLIRSSDGIKKGCAFVKYSERDSALAAIQNLHGTIALEDSDRPLIVKIADTKNQKKHRMNMNHNQNHNQGQGMYAHAGHETPISNSPQVSINGNMYPYMPPPGAGPSTHVTVHHPHHLFPGHVQGHMQGHMQNHAHVQGHVTPNIVSSNAESPAGSYSSAGHGQYPPSFPGVGSAAPPTYVYPQVHYDAASHYADAAAAATTAPIRPSNQEGNQQRPREGPAGANLFIYHLPHDLTDADLATAFNPFGNVISAKVYVDRFTGESKGFGFVSYDSIISAEHAIEQMNGFQIGNKRLKVQHKRVNHRPPVSVPAMHHPYYHGINMNGRMPQVYHDVPLEISGPSVGVDNTYSSGHGHVVVNNDMSQFHFSQHDMINGLTATFESLNTGDPQRGGDEHQNQNQQH